MADWLRDTVEINGRQCVPLREGAQRIGVHPATAERVLAPSVFREGGRVFVAVDAVENERRRKLRQLGVVDAAAEARGVSIAADESFDFAGTDELERDEIARLWIEARQLESEAVERESEAMALRRRADALFMKFVKGLIPPPPMND